MSVIGNRMNRRTFAVVTFSFVLVSFLALGIPTPENCAQGFECGDLRIEGVWDVCIDLEFCLMDDDFTFPSDYNFREPFPEGLYLVLEKVTIINNDGIRGESKNISNLSLDIDVHPIGAEKIHVAEIIVPPLDTIDTYEIVLPTTITEGYESKLNGEPSKMELLYPRPIKLTTDGWWQIDLKPASFVNMPLIFINGEYDNYFFKVYSEYEIKELETAKNNLWISRFSLLVIIAVGLATIYFAKKQGEKNIKDITGELKGVTEELREVARGIKTLTEKQKDQKQDGANSEKKKN